MTTNLLPCPFCGGTKIKQSSDDGQFWNTCQQCFTDCPPNSKRCDEGAPDWNTRAKSAPAEPVSREAVEVVGYLTTASKCGHSHEHGAFNYLAVDAIAQEDHWRERGCTVTTDELMTVAQCNRIVAALAPPSPDAELVALLRDASMLIDLLRSEKTIRGDGNPPGLTIAKCEGVLDRIDAKLASLK